MARNTSGAAIHVSAGRNTICVKYLFAKGVRKK